MTPEQARTSAVGNHDQAFQKATGDSHFGDSLAQFRREMFAFLDTQFSEIFSQLPEAVRAQVITHFNGSDIVEAALNSVANRVVETEATIVKARDGIQNIIQISKRELASAALKGGSVPELLYQMGNLRDIIDMSALLMQENFRFHSALATVAVDPAIIDSVFNRPDDFIETWSFEASHPSFGLSSSWVFSEKKVPIDLRVLNEVLTTAAKDLIPRYRTAGIHHAYEALNAVVSEDILEPLRGFLLTQEIGIFPILHGEIQLGAMINLLDKDALQATGSRRPDLEFAGLAANTANAILRTFRIPERLADTDELN